MPRINDMLALMPDAAERPTWQDIERRSLHDAYLHRLVTLVGTGTCSKEDALIATVLALSSSLQTANNELIKHAMERI